MSTGYYTTVHFSSCNMYRNEYTHRWPMTNIDMHVYSINTFLYNFSTRHMMTIRINWCKGVNQTPSRFVGTVYPKKYAHGFFVLCFVVVMQLFIINSHEIFIHINQGCFAGTGAIVRLPQCQWSKPDGYGKISQCITTTKHSKAKTVCIFLGIYSTSELV